jgi:hypothetical protein
MTLTKTKTGQGNDRILTKTKTGQDNDRILKQKQVRAITEY